MKFWFLFLCHNYPLFIYNPCREQNRIRGIVHIKESFTPFYKAFPLDIVCAS